MKPGLLEFAAREGQRCRQNDVPLDHCPYLEGPLRFCWRIAWKLEDMRQREKDDG